MKSLIGSSYGAMVFFAFIVTAAFSSRAIAMAKAPAPVNPKASPEAVRLLSYIYNLKDQGLTLSGQHEDLVMDNALQVNDGVNVIQSQTGKFPAIRGIEIGASAAGSCHPDSRLETVYQSYVKYGSIPMLTWHMPSFNPDAINHKSAEHEPCATSCNFYCTLEWTNLHDLHTAGTATNKNFNKALNYVVQQIKYFSDRNVPVIFRPFHEMSDGGFWWGQLTKGNTADDFRATWKYLQQYLADRGLNNILWAWTGGTFTANYATYWPGSDSVDLAGGDVYAGPREGCPTLADIPTSASRFDKSYSAWSGIYKELSKSLYGGKPIGLAETDYIPDTSRLLAQGTHFAWFLGWEGQYLACNLSSASPTLAELYSRPFTVNADNLFWTPTYADGWVCPSQATLSIQGGGNFATRNQTFPLYSADTDGKSMNCKYQVSSDNQVYLNASTSGYSCQISGTKAFCTKSGKPGEPYACPYGRYSLSADSIASSKTAIGAFGELNVNIAGGVWPEYDHTTPAGNIIATSILSYQDQLSCPYHSNNFQILSQPVPSPASHYCTVESLNGGTNNGFVCRRGVQ